MAPAVEEYVALAPEAHRRALEQLRQVVRSTAPDTEEVIRRGVPAYLYNGRPLVSIGAARRHVALYVMYGSVLATHAADLAGYATSRTVVRFDPAQPIPAPLITKLVRARAAEIDDAHRQRKR